MSHTIRHLCVVASLLLLPTSMASLLLRRLQAIVPVAMGAFVATLAGCADTVAPQTEKHAELASNQFFANAVRRDADVIEGSRVARIANVGCAAFFLENTSNQVFVATARHCFDFKMTEWCAGGGGIVDNAGKRGACAGIVAMDSHHDIAVFRATIDHVSTGDTTLRLADYVPKSSTKLVMTGYPVDEDPEQPRRGRLTTTENCWTLSGAVDSPYIGKDNDATIDRSARHN